MDHRDYRKGTVPCHTWRMIRAQEEDLYFKRPAVPGRRPAIVMPEALLAPKTVVKADPAPQVEAAPVVVETTPAPGLLDLRLARYGDELERLYRAQFQGDLAAWDGLLTLLRRYQESRPQDLLDQDQRREADPDWYCRRDRLAMTADAAAFAGSLSGVAEKLPYLKECGVDFLRLSADGTMAELASVADACRAQDICLCLELKESAPQNAASFQTWVGSLLELANAGADALCLGDLSLLPHPVVRMARLIVQLVCPGVLLAGKAPACGDFSFTPDKPGCHLLCREGGALLWNALATGDTALLRHQIQQALSLPREQIFLNRLHSDDGLDWALDYGWLKEHCGADEGAHRQYLNDWACGQFPGSNSRGQLYNDDPRLGDARLCGTTASLCGVEAADYEQDNTKLEQAVACDLLLHAFLLTQSGLPALISGDEVGQLNDYSCHEDAHSLQHGPFQWELAAMRNDENTRQGKQFQGLRRLTQLRAQEPVFDPRADVWTFDTGNPHVLGLGRWYEGRKLVALFNFSGDFVSASAPEAGSFEELVYGGHYDELGHVELYPYSFVWLLQH